MAFQTRCPECEAKLKFDEAPDAEEAIECPRCGHVFDAAEAKPIPKKQKALAGGGGDDAPRKKKKKSGGGSGEKSKIPKKRKVKIKKSNPVIIWVMIIGTLLVAPAIGWVGYKLFYSTGKIGQLMGYVPPGVNLMRGIDVERMGKYPGFDMQLKRSMEGPFSDCRDELARAAGSATPEKFLDYAMSAKIMGTSGSTGTMYVFQTIEPFNVATMNTGLGGKAENVDGQDCQKLGAKTGVMNNAYVYFPTDRIIVVVANEGAQMAMLKASIAAKGSPKDGSVMAKLGDTGKKVTRAHIWYLMLADNQFMKNKLKNQIADPIKGSMQALSQQIASAKMFGSYLWFGKMIIYGVAIETDGDGSAANLAKSMRDGELGKGEDGEYPRELVNLFHVIRNMEFSEFKANLRFASKGACAFLESKMELAKSMQVLTYFNKQDMWEDKYDGPPK